LSPPAFDVLAIGELNPDLVLSGLRATTPRLGTEQEFDAYVLTLGSSTAIACVLMQRLGLATAMSAWVGDDDYGRFCRAALVAEHVDDAMVRVHPTLATGLTVCLPYPADRLLLTCKGTMTLNPAEGLDGARLRQARHIHVGSFFLQDALRPHVANLFAAARALGLTTSLDTGWDPQEQWLSADLRAALEHTSYLFPNATEFEHLAGTRDIERGMACLLDLGPGAIVLKQGAGGAVQGDATGLCWHPGFSASPVDTTGAGDAFNAGYCAAMLRGAPVADRLMFGNACGALTVAAIGGTGGVINAEQVNAFITRQTWS
jgi:sugar/nucleoside kinase (ribokinase family)